LAAHGFDTTGIPVRNAIDQNQEFAFCGFALAWIAIDAFRRKQTKVAAVLFGLAALFFANIFFIALARTSLVYIVPLAALLVVRAFSRKSAAIGLLVLMAGMVTLWIASPHLRGRVSNIAVEYQEYREINRPTSTGQRLQYWASAVDWIKEAPIAGHGTGATKRLFNQAAEGQAGAWGQRIGNPHNQLLYVAIEWGLLGCAVLMFMWWLHYRHFRSAGIVAWIGTLVVVQNVLSSTLNSHLFDFTEGWMYVLGVGVAAGAMVKSSAVPG
jgi:O-antigen ligase